ncbi:MAG: hypothetical protein J6E46_11125 [Faecalicoccus sp.]|nr:hypothetical protein [Faecalicoccus sp.]
MGNKDIKLSESCLELLMKIASTGHVSFPEDIDTDQEMDDITLLDELGFVSSVVSAELPLPGTFSKHEFFLTDEGREYLKTHYDLVFTEKSV